MKTTTSVGINTRLTKAQKDLFGFAAMLGGYRNLTEFVIQSAQLNAMRL